MKRARTTKGASLTGGTGDFNPQTYSITIGNNGVDGRNTAGFPTPIPRFGSTGTTSPVMEILKVYFVVDDLTAMAAQTSIVCSLSTASLAAVEIAVPNDVQLILDPRVIAFISLDGIFSTAAGFALTSRVTEFDLTDGSGRGILVATDTIYLNINTINTGRINYVHAKILYRLKNVTLQEYVGIVQSQQ